MVGGWILDRNTLPFFEVLADIVGYDFDPDDWVALEWGIKDSDSDANPVRWFEYSFGDTSVSVGQDQGTAVVNLRIEAQEKHVQAIETAINIMSGYTVVKDNS